jgi:putative hemolysin
MAIILLISTDYYIFAPQNGNMPEKALHIDVAETLKTKLPKYYKFIPNFAIRWLAHTICQDQLNDILERNNGKEGVDFATAVLHDLNVTLNIEGEENIPDEGHFTFASNHPLGGLDGLALISYIGKKFAGKIHFVVNDILMQVRPLAPVFLPVNEHGAQRQNAVKALNSANSSDNQIIVFPSGICSRRQKDGRVADRTWHKSFIKSSVEYHRDVIPVHFVAQNSKFFYRMANFRERIGMKFNIEMIYLPSEMLKCHDRTFTIRFGKPVTWQSLTDLPYGECAQHIRNLVYNL